MISFKDIFKSSFLENVNAVTLPDMAIALVLAFLVGLFIFFVYKKTYSGVLYSSSFGVTLVALTMITTLVILAVTSNVVLSLGMVGALSGHPESLPAQSGQDQNENAAEDQSPGHRYEKRRQHLIEQEQGDHELHGPQVSAGQHQQPLVGPKKVRMGPSSQRSPAQASSARPRDPSTETVKYGFSLPSGRALPRLVLKITLPPMPISRPRL